LHYIGQKMKNVATTKIWLKVRDLLHEVGSKCGVEPSVIDNIDLDNVIEQAIAKNEGKPTQLHVDDVFVWPRETAAELLSLEPESAGQPNEMYPLLSKTKKRSRSKTQQNLASLIMKTTLN
uniref:Ras-associating domain-containing protein n=1 Tax=Gongylonema pulchrum TaxID=637853 RepID=A0A183EQA6_9BILA